MVGTLEQENQITFHRCSIAMHTFQRPGKLSASSSETFVTTKSLKMNHGLMALGFTPKPGNRNVKEIVRACAEPLTFEVNVVVAIYF